MEDIPAAAYREGYHDGYCDGRRHHGAEGDDDELFGTHDPVAPLDGWSDSQSKARASEVFTSLEKPPVYRRGAGDDEGPYPPSRTAPK